MCEAGFGIAVSVIDTALRWYRTLALHHHLAWPVVQHAYLVGEGIMLHAHNTVGAVVQYAWSCTCMAASMSLDEAITGGRCSL